MGSRFLRAWNKADERALDRLRERVRTLLDEPHPVAWEAETVLDPPPLALTSGAATLWRSFHDEIEGELSPNGRLARVQPYGAKLAEQAGRIAGVFAVIERGPGSKVTQEQMQRAIALARFYIQEFVRLQASAAEAVRLQPADQLDDWLRAWSEGRVLKVVETFDWRSPEPALSA